MDKDEVKSFLRFLDGATWNELLEHQAKLEKTLEFASHDSTRSDARFCLRLVGEEIAARIEVQKVLDRSKLPRKRSV